MSVAIQVIFHWAEAWPLLIPLYIYIIRKPQNKSLELIAAYLLATFSINMIGIVSARFNNCMPVYIKNNNFLYNISSFIRIIFFTVFLRNITNH